VYGENPMTFECDSLIACGNEQRIGRRADAQFNGPEKTEDADVNGLGEGWEAAKKREQVSRDTHLLHRSQSLTHASANGCRLRTRDTVDSNQKRESRRTGWVEGNRETIAGVL
jgi:hypothetical protein